MHWTVIGTGASIVLCVYFIFRKFTKELSFSFKERDEHIFFLLTGESFKENLIESKNIKKFGKEKES